MPRLFVAIDLPDAIKDQLLELQRDDISTAIWPKHEAFHLTLHFIGNVPDGVASAYERVLQEVDASAFDLTVGGVGQFPIDQRARVIWAGVDNTPELRALYEGVGTALEDEGFNREERRYHPHITIMRFPRPIRSGVGRTWINEHISWHLKPEKITEFSLYESELKSGGTIYSKRQTYKLSE